MHSGKTLMLFRKFKNKSQQEIARKLNTTQQYISELEQQENINGNKINKILIALNTTKDEWEKFKKLVQLHQV
jgi:transcriptional regulator with XRE-family HTH domain